ncbi:TIGR04076 family protein [Candidatus Peregrinibacteria bacterium]|nr:TIGR04076 family protein [Candidatus Peregrinibacteria bacterium]
MAKYNLKITVVEVRGGGKCEKGLKVGDTLMYSEDKIDFCAWAHNAMFPFISAMRYGAKFPWEPNSETAYVSCPDPHNTVVFKIERLDNIEK